MKSSPDDLETSITCLSSASSSLSVTSDIDEASWISWDAGNDLYEYKHTWPIKYEEKYASKETTNMRTENSKPHEKDEDFLEFNY